MKFRPCIDIHNGSVKQIVGGTLSDRGNQAEDNFVSEYDAAFYANMYREDGLTGGHIILLNKADSEYYEADLAGKRSIDSVSEGAADWRWCELTKCGVLFGYAGKSCDRYVFCVSGWQDRLGSSETISIPGRTRTFGVGS